MTVKKLAEVIDALAYLLPFIEKPCIQLVVIVKNILILNIIQSNIYIYIYIYIHPN